MTNKFRLFFTGGHHNSTLSLVDWLLQYSNENQQIAFDIFWFGRKYIANSKNNSPEFEEVSRRKAIQYINYNSGKFYRIRSIKYFPHLLYYFLLTPLGILKACFYILKYRPSMVISFGGYIGLPFVFCAWLTRTKSVMHEQTATIGLANKISSIFVNKIFLTWPIETYKDDKFLRLMKKKLVFTGLPLRDISDSSIEFNFSNTTKRILFIMGGKLGSEFLNKLIIDNVEFLSEKFNIIWAIGSKQGDYSIGNIAKILQEKNIQNCFIKDYFNENEMSYIYKTCDLIISRAGAHSIYEYVAFKKFAIVIPIPWSSQNEQFRNAKILEKFGLGFILEEKNIDQITFQEIIDLATHKIQDENLVLNIDNSGYLLGKRILGNEIIGLLQSKK